MYFDFERLEVYKKALDFVEYAFRICDNLDAKLQSSIGDQLKRASLSIVNNIAEGSGQTSNKMKRNFYEIALNSSRECVPMIDLLSKLKLVDQNKKDELKDLCSGICKMLCGLIRSIEN